MDPDTHTDVAIVWRLIYIQMKIWWQLKAILQIDKLVHPGQPEMTDVLPQVTACDEYP
ncbi:hypothetical protein D3C79_1102770 [compost metagenome]